MAINVYQDWLGITKSSGKPSYYELLDIAPTESVRAVIDKAARDRMARVRVYQVGAYAAECQNLLSELAVAYVTLITPDRRTTYDAQLNAPPPLPKQVQRVQAIDAGYGLAPEVVEDRTPGEERHRDFQRAMTILAAAANSPQRSLKVAIDESVRLGLSRDEARAIIDTLQAARCSKEIDRDSVAYKFVGLANSLKDLVSEHSMLVLGVVAAISVLGLLYFTNKYVQRELGTSSIPRGSGPVVRRSKESPSSQPASSELKRREPSKTVDSPKPTPPVVPPAIPSPPPATPREPSKSDAAGSNSAAPSGATSEPAAKPPAPEPFAGLTEQLVVGLRGSFTPSKSDPISQELALGHEIAQLAQANLAVFALSLRGDRADVAAEITASLKRIDEFSIAADAPTFDITRKSSALPSRPNSRSPGGTATLRTTKRAWRNVDDCLDSYAQAASKQLDLLGENRPAIPRDATKVQQHVLLTEELLQAVFLHCETRLKSLGGERLEAARKALQEVKQTAALEQIAATTSLQRLCQAHLRICDSLACVCLLASREVSGDAQRFVADVRKRDYTMGLEQLRGLLYCELQLWSLVAQISKG